MDVQFSQDQERFVRQAIATGRMVDAEEAVRQALSFWEERESQRVGILSAIAQAQASVACGEGRRIDSEADLQQVAKAAIAAVRIQNGPVPANLKFAPACATQSKRHAGPASRARSHEARASLARRFRNCGVSSAIAALGLVIPGYFRWIRSNNSRKPGSFRTASSVGSALMLKTSKSRA